MQITRFYLARLVHGKAELEGSYLQRGWLQTQASACRPIGLTDDPNDFRNFRKRSQRRHRDCWRTKEDSAHARAYTRMNGDGSEFERRLERAERPRVAERFARLRDS
jgi:hypothetical protein